jgi:hypothetical protein
MVDQFSGNLIFQSGKFENDFKQNCPVMDAVEIPTRSAARETFAPALGKAACQHPLFIGIRLLVRHCGSAEKGDFSGFLAQVGKGSNEGLLPKIEGFGRLIE